MDKRWNGVRERASDMERKSVEKGESVDIEEININKKTTDKKRNKHKKTTKSRNTK